MEQIQNKRQVQNENQKEIGNEKRGEWQMPQEVKREEHQCDHFPKLMLISLQF